VIPSDVREHLAHSYSGFTGLDPTQVGWIFEERKISDIIVDGTSPSMHVQWVPDTSLFMSAAHPFNIFHSAQIASGLLHAVYYHMSNIDDIHLTQYQWVQEIRRIILPTVFRDDLAWTLGFMKIAHDAVKAATGRGHGQGQGVYTHLKEDLDTFFTKAEKEHSFVCFEKVVIVGAQELSTPFLTSDSEASLFRSSVDDVLALTPSSTQKATFSTHGNYNDKGDDYFLLQSKNLGPNNGVRVTILLRERSRRILNLPSILMRLRKTGVVDESWLDNHILFFDQISFRSQVSIMHNTDVFIAPHGSGLQNLMFLRGKSAVIELFTSPWYEPGYQPTAVGMGLHYYVVPITRLDMVRNCEISHDCLSSELLVSRRSLECLSIRTCDALIDVDALEVSFWLATQAVRITKRDLLQWRYGDKGCCIDSGHIGDRRLDVVRTQAEALSQADSHCSNHCFYEKGYKSLR